MDDLVLVSGGCGFIGSNLARSLLIKGYRVRLVDDLSTGRLDNLDGIYNDIELIRGNVADQTIAERAVKGVRYVLHQAAIPSAPRSFFEPLLVNRANVTGTLCLLTSAIKADVERFIMASSSSIYGDTDLLPKVETMPPAPMSPYAVSKLAAESYTRIISAKSSIVSCCLRYFNIFGPYQDPDSPYSAVIPLFINNIMRNEPLTIYGDGSQSRDFTFVDNVVLANLLALKAEGIDGEVLNIGCGKRYTVKHLAEMLMEIAGNKVPINHLPPRRGDVMHSQADIAKARNLLGYSPVIELKQGLLITWEFFNTK